MIRLVVMLLLTGCASSRVPAADAAPVARRFARACARGDADAIHDLLSADARRALDVAAIRKLLAENGSGGGPRCRALAEAPLSVSGAATFQFDTGDAASITFDEREAHVAAAGAMPGGGATPEAALASFRSSLVRWLSGTALAPLTASTRERTATSLRTLAEGLEHPEALFVDVSGDRAKVDVDPGHVVHLRRETGLWRVEAFE